MAQPTREAAVNLKQLWGQACTIDIKGYICVIGAAIRRSEANMETDGQLGKKIEKIRGIPDL